MTTTKAESTKDSTFRSEELRHMSGWSVALSATRTNATQCKIRKEKANRWKNHFETIQRQHCQHIIWVLKERPFLDGTSGGDVMVMAVMVESCKIKIRHPTSPWECWCFCWMFKGIISTPLLGQSWHRIFLVIFFPKALDKVVLRVFRLRLALISSISALKICTWKGQQRCPVCSGTIARESWWLQPIRDNASSMLAMTSSSQM